MEKLHLTTFELKQRGWTTTMITRLLPNPDLTRAPYPKSDAQFQIRAPVKLYLLARIEEVETTEDFLIAEAEAKKAQVRGQKLTQTRAANSQASIKMSVAQFRPKFSWPADVTGESAWERSLWEVECYFQGQCRRRLANVSKTYQQQAFDALKAKNQLLFVTKFPDWIAFTEATDDEVRAQRGGRLGFPRF